MLKSHSRRIVSCFLVLLASAFCARGEDWPTYQHDNQRTGVTSEQVGPPLRLQWQFDPNCPPAKGWSEPIWGRAYGFVLNKSNVSYDDAFRVVSVGNTAFFCSSGENKVYAVDAATGKTLWCNDSSGEIYMPQPHPGAFAIG